MSDTKIEDGGPAFPCETYGLKNGKETTIPTNGMTLRDWFAGQALAGLVQNGQYASGQIAQSAYSFADAMLSARNKKE